MQYSIPEGYPEKLLPVKVKITSNHSVPSRRKTTLWPYTNEFRQYLFLEGNFFEDYEMSVTFTNSVK